MGGNSRFHKSHHGWLVPIFHLLTTQHYQTGLLVNSESPNVELGPLLEKAHVGTVSYRPKYSKGSGIPTLALIGFRGSKESMEKVARAGSALCT